MNIIDVYTGKDWEDSFRLQIDIPMNIVQAYTDKDCHGYC